jgi:hypothetical protein
LIGQLSHETPEGRPDLFQGIAAGVIPSMGAVLAAQSLGVVAGLALASWLGNDAKPPRGPIA